MSLWERLSSTLHIYTRDAFPGTFFETDELGVSADQWHAESTCVWAQDGAIGYRHFVKTKLSVVCHHSETCLSLTE